MLVEWVRSLVSDIISIVIFDKAKQQKIELSCNQNCILLLHQEV